MDRAVKALRCAVRVARAGGSSTAAFSGLERTAFGDERVLKQALRLADVEVARSPHDPVIRRAHDFIDGAVRTHVCSRTTSLNPRVHP